MWTYADTGVVLIAASFLCGCAWTAGRHQEGKDHQRESLLTFFLGRLAFFLAFVAICCFMLNEVER